MTRASERRWLSVAMLLIAVAVGSALGSLATIARLPPDPTGELASPVAGAFTGLLIATALLASRRRSTH